MTREKIPKGIISMSILAVLWDKGGYGYLVQKEVESLTGLSLSKGEIYSMLRHLEIRGLIVKMDNSGKIRRTYYKTTDKGKIFFLSQKDVLAKSIKAIQDLEKFIEDHSANC
ncbi:MAG: PadR family transcriptional regulator [Thermoplasmatales archaeon]